MRAVPSLCCAARVVAALALPGCFPDGDLFDCTTDDECGDEDVVCLEEGFCGAPERAPCPLAAFAVPEGNSAIFVSSALREPDPDNGAACANAADAAALDIIVDGPFVADLSGNEVRLSIAGAFPQACAGRIVAERELIRCPVCFPETADVAVQVEGDDGLLSNAVCVEVDKTGALTLRRRA